MTFAGVLEPLDTLKLVPFQPEYTFKIVDLIDSIYREYGFYLCLPDAEIDLLTIAENFPDGTFQVLIDEQHQVYGTVGVSQQNSRPENWYLKRLYLHATCRGSEWATNMVEWAESKAIANGAERIELWSDIQFTRAHTFYENLGYQKDDRVRSMLDSWVPYKEFFFHKELKP